MAPPAPADDVPDGSDSTAAPPLAGIAAWGGPGLLLAPEATARVIRKRLSPSSASAIASCPARWAIDFLIPKEADPFGAAELGTATHKVLEEMFQLPPDLRTPLEARRLIRELDLRFREVVAPRSATDLSRWREEVTDRVVGIWSIEDPTEVDVVGTERRLKDVPVAGVPFVGVIDRLERRPEGITVVDFKAGKAHRPGGRYDSHGDQLRLYAMAYTASSGDEPAGAEVYYSRHGVKAEVDISAPALKKTSDGFVASWDAMRSCAADEAFPARPSALCGWCAAVTVCPAAQASRWHEPRVASAAGGERLGIETVAPVRLTASRPGAGAAPGPSSSTLERTSDLSAQTPIPATAAPIERRTIMGFAKHEDKVWNETDDQGDLNPNSYAATAAFGVVEMAVETLHGAGEKVTPKSVHALSRTFNILLAKSARDLGHDASLQDGLHARLRGALRTTLSTLPVPFGGDAEAWASWADRATLRIGAIAKEALRVYSDLDLDDEAPWAPLAHSGEIVQIDSARAAK